MRQNILKAGLLLAVAVLTISLVKAADMDLHWLWENRCADCHGHAGDFARQFLNNSNGILQGRHHVQDMRRFMHNHYLNESEVDAVYNMLLAQTSTPARFKQECSSCHQTAARFVRNSLQLRDGLLYIRKSNRPVSSFLAHHRELTPADAEFFTTLLTRVANEVYQP